MEYIEISYAKDAVDIDEKHFEILDQIDCEFMTLLNKEDRKELEALKKYADEDDVRDWVMDKRESFLHDILIKNGDLIEVDEWSDENNHRPKLMLKIN
tara:strand:+ start:114 stop:407 length:294 start_codon:yes stop_codon:yes gene_type:complete